MPLSLLETVKAPKGNPASVPIQVVAEQVSEAQAAGTTECYQKGKLNLDHHSVVLPCFNPNFVY